MPPQADRLPIRTILSALPPEFHAAVLVVQHIAAGFSIAEWLAGAWRLLAVDGELVVPGHVYIAVGGWGGAGGLGGS